MFKNILKSFKINILFFLFMGLASLLSLLRTLFFGYVLAPEEMGYVSLTITLVVYFTYSQLGVTQGLSVELPISLGKKNYQQAEDYINNSASSLFIFHFIFSIGFLLLLLVLPIADNTKRLTLFFVPIISFFQIFIHLYYVRLQSYQLMLSYSLYYFSLSLLVVIFGLLLGYRHGAFGVLNSYLLASMVVLTAMYIYLPKIKLHALKLDNVKKLIKVGFPLACSSILISLKLSIDKIILSISYPIGDIGIYHFAGIPLLVAVTISNILREFMLPKILYLFGRDNDIQIVCRMSMYISGLILIGYLLCLPLAIVVFSNMVEILFPRYTSAIPLFKVFYVTSAFIAASTFDAVYSAAKQQIFYLILTTSVFATFIIAIMFLVNLQAEMIMFAYLGLAMQIIMYLSLLSYTAITYFSGISKTNNLVSV